MSDDTRRLVAMTEWDARIHGVSKNYDAALPLVELRERIAEVLAPPRAEASMYYEAADAVLRVLLAESGDAS